MENGSLLARRLDLDPPRLVGDPARLAENIAINNGLADFSLSTGSTLFYSRDAGGSKHRFAWWDRSGKKLETVGPTVESAVGAFRLSPEGRRVAYVSETIPTDIWVLDIARGNNARLTFQGGDLPHLDTGREADLLQVLAARDLPQGGGLVGRRRSGGDRLFGTSNEHRRRWPDAAAGIPRYLPVDGRRRGQTATLVEDTVPRGMGGCLAARALGGIPFK